MNKILIILAVVLVLSAIAIQPAAARSNLEKEITLFIDDVSRALKNLQKAAVFEYNVRGSIGGLPVSVIAITDTQAVVDFDNYGRIIFSTAGFGESESIKVQLNQQHGRYFCTVSVCGGLNAWISDSAAITWKTEKPRAYNRLTSLGNGYFHLDAYNSLGESLPRDPTWYTGDKDRTRDAFNSAVGYPELVINSNVYAQYKSWFDEWILASKRTDVYIDNFHNVLYYQVAPKVTIPQPTYQPTPTPIPTPTPTPSPTPTYTIVYTPGAGGGGISNPTPTPTATSQPGTSGTGTTQEFEEPTLFTSTNIFFGLIIAIIGFITYTKLYVQKETKKGSRSRRGRK